MWPFSFQSRHHSSETCRGRLLLFIGCLQRFQWIISHCNYGYPAGWTKNSFYNSKNGRISAIREIISELSIFCNYSTHLSTNCNKYSSLLIEWDIPLNSITLPEVTHWSRMKPSCSKSPKSNFRKRNIVYAYFVLLSLDHLFIQFSVKKVQFLHLFWHFESMQFHKNSSFSLILCHFWHENDTKINLSQRVAKNEM